MSDLETQRDQIREITHRNVERLVDAHKSERGRIDGLQRQVAHLETQVQILLSKLSEAQNKANQAFAIAQQVRIGTSSDGHNN